MQRLDNLFKTFCFHAGVDSKELAPFENKIKEKIVPALPWVYSPPNENETRDRFLEPKLDELFLGVRKELGIPQSAVWPNNAPYAVALTHDIDRIFSTLHPLKRKKDLKHLTLSIKDTFSVATGRNHRNSFFNFSRLHEFNSKNKIHSCLYVLFEKRRFRKAFREKQIQHIWGVYSPKTIQQELLEFAASGNEIGLHTSFDGFHNKEALKTEFKSLKSFGFTEAIGLRNHYLHHEHESTEKIQTEVGFRYDSTLGFNFQNGFRLGTSLPVFRYQLWELPLLLMDSALRVQNFSKPVIEKIYHEVRSHQGVLMLNWHFHTMNPEIFPNEMEILQRIIDRAKADGAYIARPIDIYSHWLSRQNPIKLSYEPHEMDEKGALPL